MARSPVWPRGLVPVMLHHCCNTGLSAAVSGDTATLRQAPPYLNTSKNQKQQKLFKRFSCLRSESNLTRKKKAQVGVLKEINPEE
ncbi:hypothetical protein Y1Q_0000018 [Alligator mississippiensis]|uniref:Uncharacterized protein n=1 Tax=Alligator mississippiensis TaxID=8496 RepID=A0A151NTR5_ALLMI|nr:hypothetical protein Y1Q_0000018 [Alligator mississippiensis]